MSRRLEKGLLILLFVVVLAVGAVPLTVLKQAVDRYIAAR